MGDGVPVYAPAPQLTATVEKQNDRAGRAVPVSRIAVLNGRVQLIPIGDRRCGS
jgi:hypothetical protein